MDKAFSHPETKDSHPLRKEPTMNQGLFSSIKSLPDWAVACIGAVGIGAAGFGALNIFWYFEKATYPDIPGLYDYRAATFGDGFLIPLFVASAIYLLRQFNKTIYLRFSTLIAGLIGFAIGCGIQAQWLISPDTGPNWTIPRPHHFTAAGWYHAVFLSLALGLAAAILAALWKCLRNDPAVATKQENGIVLGGFWTGGLGFLTMLSLDNYSAAYPQMLILLVAVGLSFMITIAFSGTAIRRYDPADFQPAVIAHFRIILAALLVVLFFAVLTIDGILSLHIDSLAPVSTALTVVLMVPLHVAPTGTVIMYWLLCAMPAFALSATAQVADNLAPAAVWYLLAAIIPAVVSLLLPTTAQNHSPDSKLTTRKVRFYTPDDERLTVYATGILLVINGAGLITHYFDLFSGFWNILGSDFLAFAFGSVLLGGVIRFLWTPVAEGEDNDSIKQAETTRMKAGAYLRGLSVAAAVILLLISTILGLTSGIQGHWHPMSMTFNSAAAGIGFIILFCALAVIGLVRLRVSKEPTHSWIGLPIATVAYVLLIIALGGLRRPYLTAWYDFAIIFVTLGSTVFITNGYVMNLRRIHGLRITARNWVEGIVVGLGYFVTLSYSVLPTKYPDGSILLSSPLTGILGIAFGAILVPMFLALVSGADNERRRKSIVVPAEPWLGVAQDGLVAALIAVFAGLMPLFVLAIADNRSTALAVITSILSAAWFAAFSMKNNVKHLAGRESKLEESRQIAENDNDPGYLELEEIRLKNLREHLSRQNWLAAGALFPVMLVWIGWLWLKTFLRFGYKSDAEARQQASAILHSYIPAYRLSQPPIAVLPSR